MARRTDFEQDEKPLDPAAERVRQRLVRFLVINLGILFFAVMVVIGAVIYRAGFFSKSPAATASPAVIATDAAITIPSGAEILSQSVSGDRLSLHLRQTGADTIVIFDLTTGKQLGRFAIQRAVP